MDVEDGLDGAAEAYGKYAAEITRFATGLVGPSDAADVVSAAVLGCLRSGRWPAVDDPRAYLYRSVLNQARMTHRSSLRRAAREMRAAGPVAMVIPERLSEVLAAVATLSLRQRAVVMLTYWDDLDPGAVAAVLGIGEGSVRRHLARARARLRELLHDRSD